MTGRADPDGPGPAGVDDLIAVMARLRAPDGCPWDAEQTHASLVRYLIEETYELVDAIETGDPEHLKEELGDVLYQVLFHADLAAHTPGEDFDIQDVAAAAAEKMRGRHPHVFGDVGPRGIDEVTAEWERVKAAQKPDRSSVLDGIPAGMPALALAEKILGRAERVGVVSAGAPSPFSFSGEEDLGAVLLALVASARARGLDAERALRGALRGLADEVREVEAQPGPSGDSSRGARSGAGDQPSV